MNYTDCPICSSSTAFLDVVDFNKSCEELNGKYLPLSGIAIYYRICDFCNFVFAPEICSWDDGMFLEKIYNEDYIKVDPEYLIDRPRKTSEILLKKLGINHVQVRHLDYGGGNGLLSKILSLIYIIFF